MVLVGVVTDLKLLFLIAVANGVPVVAKSVLGSRFAFPIDCGVQLSDHKPLFGASKTLRGIVLSLIATPLAALVVGLDWTLGALVGAAAMAGDLLSSFLKRRANAPVSSMAIGLDQVPESLLPAIACVGSLDLSPLDIALVCVVFLSGELLVSRLLYAAGVRDRPY